MRDPFFTQDFMNGLCAISEPLSTLCSSPVVEIVFLGTLKAVPAVDYAIQFCLLRTE